MRFVIAAVLFLASASLPALAQTFTGAMSGSWWDASRGGEGQFITFESAGARNVVYLAYFTYTPDGRGTWHVGNVDYTPGAASISIPLVTGSGARFGSAFNAADVRTTPAGTATLEFVGCNQMRMRHTGMEGVTLNLTRLVGPLAGAGCGDLPPAAASLTGVISGSWWNAARSGEGQFVTFETLGSRNVASVAYFTYTADGTATWLVGNADIPVGARSVVIPLITGSGARFGADFRAADVRTEAAGTATLTLTGCEGLTLAYAGTQSFTHALSRLVGPLTGFSCTNKAVTPEPQADSTSITQLTSTHTEFLYPIMVYFPAGYSAGSGPHPVIYAPDAELQFMLIVEAVRLRNYNAIVVAVGNGGSDRRWVVYVAPGWTAYHRFLTRQLMPFIETQYRVDRTRRTLVGYSLSGSFAGVAMSLDDPAARHFSGIVAIDGSYWNQTDQIYALEQAMYDASRSLPVAMFHAAAANRVSILDYTDRLAARNYTGFRLRHQNYSLTHATVLSPGINEGLAYVFGGN
jgi:predicted alpha/beta superfamily hydrolase